MKKREVHNAEKDIAIKMASWKRAFQDKITEVTGQEFSEEESTLSFAEIFARTGHENFSFVEALDVVYANQSKIGGFKFSTQKILYDNDYHQVKKLVHHIYQGLSRRGMPLFMAFRKLQEKGPSISLMNGNKITDPLHNSDKRIASIAHTHPGPWLEIIYEGNNAYSADFPETFMVSSGNLATIKIVENLEDDPRLAAAIATSRIPYVQKEIQDRSLEWKEALKNSLEEETGQKISDDSSLLSYAEIFHEAHKHGYDLDDMHRMINQNVNHIAPLSQYAEKMLGISMDIKENKGYSKDIVFDFKGMPDDLLHAHMTAHKLLETGDDISHHFSNGAPYIDQNIAVIGHDLKSGNLMEVFLETKEEALLKLPDVLVQHPQAFYVVKAVSDLTQVVKPN